MMFPWIGRDCRHGQIVERNQRTDVIEIKTSPKTASACCAVVGAAIGFGLGLLSGEGIAHSRSGNPDLVAVALIGFPIVGGYAGSRGLRDKSPAVIYRTP